MDQKEKHRLNDRVGESEAHSREILARLPLNRPIGLRKHYARCAIDLACEHHWSFIVLTRAGSHGSAAALLRPLLEAGTTGYWLMYRANKDELTKLDDATVRGLPYEIPGLNGMLNQLKPVFPQIKTLLRNFQSGGAAKWLHGMTHGGVIQLSRRDVEKGWSASDVHHGILCADLFICLAAVLATVIYEADRLSEYVFLRRDILVKELCATFNLAPLPKQPQVLPIPLDD